VLIDIADDLREFRPEGGIHAVALFGSIQRDVGDLILNGDVKAGIGHGAVSVRGALKRATMSIG
jgi:hypothetical protein